MCLYKLLHVDNMDCSNCGEEINESAEQCPYCGAKFRSEQNQSIITKIPASWIGVSIGIVLFAVLRLVTQAFLLPIAAGSLSAVVIWFVGSILR